MRRREKEGKSERGRQKERKRKREVVEKGGKRPRKGEVGN